MNPWFSFSAKAFLKWKPMWVLAIVFFLLFELSCESVRSEDEQGQFDIVLPKLVDTATYDSIFFHPEALPFDAGFDIIYLGEPQGEIVVGNLFFDLDSFEDKRRSRRYQAWGSSRLMIYVDENQLIARELLEFRIPGSPSKRKAFRVIPIFVSNPTNDTLTIGNGHFLNGDLMRRTNDGYWQKISKPYFFYCGTGIFDILLPPQHIVVALLPAFQGKIPTRLRFQLNDAISNEFIAGFDSLPQILEQ
jgi:hypothetical protein